MCREVWYQYTCGHLKPAEGLQESWEHCDDWTTGQDEENCPNTDADEPHETFVEDRACPECQYITPPTSDESSSGESDGAEEE